MLLGDSVDRSGTKRNVTSVGTVIGEDGAHFDGDGDYIRVSNFEYAQDATFSLSFWMVRDPKLAYPLTLVRAPGRTHTPRPSVACRDGVPRCLCRRRRPAWTARTSTFIRTVRSCTPSPRRRAVASVRSRAQTVGHAGAGASSSEPPLL